jgi:F-type H+-transporting ATPase subunit a
MSAFVKVLRRIPLWAWPVIALAALAVLFVLPGGAKATFNVSNEFTLRPVIRLPRIGPVDLSVTKAVIYLWLAVVVVCIFAALVNRSLRRSRDGRPGKLQVTLEGLYELARDGIAGSVMKSGSDTWFPYIGGVFFFILTCNLVGLIPLPFGEGHQLAFYAATGNLNVTVTLALFTFVFTHYAGVRAKGAAGYIKGWVIPSAPPVLKQFIFVMHIISEGFRLVSLSVRLFANMLAGHAILGVFFAMALVFQSYLIAAVLQAGSVTLYLFEIFVAAIQAFIFAILSAVYVSSALEDEQ